MGRAFLYIAFLYIGMTVMRLTEVNSRAGIRWRSLDLKEVTRKPGLPNDCLESPSTNLGMVRYRNSHR